MQGTSVPEKGQQPLIPRKAETTVQTPVPKLLVTSASRREELLRAIAQEEARLARLESEQADSRRLLCALQADLASVGAEPTIRVRPCFPDEAPVPRTSTEKIELFRSLFRGREEVFPTRFAFRVNMGV